MPPDGDSTLRPRRTGCTSGKNAASGGQARRGCKRAAALSRAAAPRLRGGPDCDRSTVQPALWQSGRRGSDSRINFEVVAISVLLFSFQRSLMTSKKLIIVLAGLGVGGVLLVVGCAVALLLYHPYGKKI